MAKKICVDTDVCISILNGEERANQFRDPLALAELFVSSITAFELNMRTNKLDDVAGFLNKLNIVDFDGKCVMEASLTYKKLKAKGLMIDFRDLFIASSAIANSLHLATFNKKHFSNIENLKLID